MIYQVITAGRLCQSKKYFTEKKDIKNHIKQVVKKTKEYYKKDKKHIFCNEDILDGIRITRIDEQELLEWNKLFGSEQEEIGIPFIPVVIR